MKDSNTLFQVIPSEPAGRLNAALLRGFQACADTPENGSSHYFGGRYENIYISTGQLPEYGQLLELARGHAAELLATRPENLKVGGWFNAMAPGQRTSLHSHDDNDELLSAVYYIQVPEDSGDLLFKTDEGPVMHTPRAGSFVFFSPRLEHEVTENRSQQMRLSIGMNFGYTAA